MRTCPTCQHQYSDEMEYCSRDATPLPPIVAGTEFDLALGLSRRYRIVRHLGAGGMGSVFLAEQLTVGSRLVALKILRRSLLEDPEFLQRFRDEASSTGRIRHQNVVTVYECGQTDDGSPYIAMEYLEGESLREYLKREGSIPVDTAAEILQQAGRGLNAAHKLGIIHRDLKPDNIFLTRDDDGKLLVKIVDFGIAKMRESTTHTMTGLAVGTPAYMSVEQASGMRSEEIDGRSDIYSLGIVAYEMLAGAVPFRADTPLAYVQKHLTEPPAPLSVTRPDLNIPPQVEQVVMKSLKKDREERYPNAPEFTRAFADAVASQHVNFPETQEKMAVAAPFARRGKPRVFATILVAAAVLLLSASAVAWYMLRGRSQLNQVAPRDHSASSIANQRATPIPTIPPRSSSQNTAPATATSRPRKFETPPPSLDHAVDLIKARDYNQALPIIKKLAADGNAEAERYLAEMYRNGWDLRQDNEQALHWYKRAAAAGNIAAFTGLGHIYDYGWGVPQDYAQARSWYEKAAASGNATAMVDLGRLYERGLGIQQDYSRARQWYERAAAAGNTAAMLDLGHFYEHGWGVATDYAQARQWYQRAVAAGNPMAANNLARLSQEEKVGQDHDRPLQNREGSLDRNPSPEASALLKKARTEWQVGNRDAALADVNSAISNSARWPLAYLLRANWEYDMGNTKAALADYSACIERQPTKVNFIGALRGRAKVRDRLGDTKGAEADREQAQRVQNEIR